jgi:glutathione S-transferase
MFKLFTAPGTCALAVHIALEEAAAPHEIAWVDLKSNAQRSPDYLKLNPKGRVPALATPEGVLTETPALLAFIGQSFPDAHLVPASPFEFARLQSVTSYLCSTVHVAHAHRPRGIRWVDAADTEALEAMRRNVPRTMGECFEYIENELFTGPWLMGEQYTVADPYLFTIAGWLESDGVDPSRFPKVLGHTRRMKERPAVARVLAQLPA